MTILAPLERGMLPKWQRFLRAQACAFWRAVVTYQRRLNANA